MEIKRWKYSGSGNSVADYTEILEECEFCDGTGEDKDGNPCQECEGRGKWTVRI